MKAKAFGFILFAPLVVFGQTPRGVNAELGGRAPRWAVFLKADPLAEKFLTRTELRSAAALAARRSIEMAQDTLSAQLAERKIRKLGAVQTLLNAVFVAGTKEQLAEVAGWPGVEGVVPLRAYKRTMNRALDLVNGRQGWEIAGGEGNAGLNTRIGIIDSGIDHTHPAFQDSSLPAVAGAPFCSGSNCDYTNRKIIAARSYVEQLSYFYSNSTRPDDNSPRDRVGHGTAVAMIAAGVRNESPIGAITGVAPKAFLGNYKVFGSPGVNDYTVTDVLISALNDAFNDGMDIVTLSIRNAADWGPLDQGATCDLSGSTPCDPLAFAINNAVRAGMVVVAAAGNDGDAAQYIPALNSITSPGTAPEAITVGATTNSHQIFQTVKSVSSGGPVRREINGRFGNGPLPGDPLQRPVTDVATLGDNGQACSSLALGSLAGRFALIQAGGCDLRSKTLHAQVAGADGVIYMRDEGNDSVYAPTGLQRTGIPLIVIGHTDGNALREDLRGDPNMTAIIDPALREVEDAFLYADYTAIFTSYGPNIRLGSIKPELVAPGTNMVTATQNYDPNGDMWSASRYTVIGGTSFAVPVAAGAAALLKQRNRGWSPIDIKSALVNTATNAVDDFDNTGAVVPASVKAMGGGKLQVDAALRTNVTVDPATISLGAIARTATTLPSVGLVFRNSGSSAVTLRLTVRAKDSDGNAQLTLSSSTFTLQAGATSEPVTARLEGRTPNPGSYEGDVLVEGGAVPLRIPFLYLVGDGVPTNVLPLINAGFEGVVNNFLLGGFLFKVVDRYGVPVQGLNVRWSVLAGGADLSKLVASRATDDLGIAAASDVYLGPAVGEQAFQATIDRVTDPIIFAGIARPFPALLSGSGIVNGASFEPGKPVAPGSWVTVQGRDLADASMQFDSLGTPYIPLSLMNVSVSIDMPGGGTPRGYAVPVSYVSREQINIQLPWELQGVTTANLKVSIGDHSSAQTPFTIADYAPAPFQYRDSTGVLFVAARPSNTGDVIGSSRPAERGSFVTIYANGLGPVTNTPPTGEAAKPDPLSRCRADAQVTIGGRPAAVTFCGLTPGAAGLHQVDIQVPSDAPTGVQDVVITVNGVSSTPAKMPIQ